MAVTILEALQNANINLDNVQKIGIALLPLAKTQLNNAVTLLEKGYDLDTEVEPLLEKYGDVDSVPKNSTKMSNFKVLELLAEENTPDGIGLCPDIVEYKRNGTKGTVTVGVPPQVIDWLIQGTHSARLLVIKTADFERIKAALDT